MLRKRLLYLLFTIVTLGCFIWFQNNSISTSQTIVPLENLPVGFDQFKIVHLSDLHNKEFGKDQQVIIRKVQELHPDIIVFTGDLIDSNRVGNDASLILMEELTTIAPVYYVSGNHEWWSGRFSSLEQSLSELGVQVLRNAHDTIEIGNDKINIAGIDDPAHDSDGRTEVEIVEQDIGKLKEGLEERIFTILLTHRPELLTLYAESGFDMVFAGHAHGGQARLPFIGGLVAPNQGFLPNYTAGKHELGHTVMIVSRGLGNSFIPVRLFNRPEIVAVTLKAEKN